MSGPGARRWPVEFSDVTRTLIIARDTPPGRGLPACWGCGLGARPAHLHHVLFRGRGGRGCPCNGIVLHDGCHATCVHDRAKDAAALDGWARSQFAPDPCALPVRCPWRGWVILDDAGGWSPAPAGAGG